jgi:hypothetical protein
MDPNEGEGVDSENLPLMNIHGGNVAVGIQGWNSVGPVGRGETSTDGTGHWGLSKRFWKRMPMCSDLKCGVQVKLELKPDARPRFHKPCSAIKSAIEQDIDRSISLY